MHLAEKCSKNTGGSPLGIDRQTPLQKFVGVVRPYWAGIDDLDALELPF